jgi:hypothetical protein
VNRCQLADIALSRDVTTWRKMGCPGTQKRVCRVQTGPCGDTERARRAAAHCARLVAGSAISEFSPTDELQQAIEFLTTTMEAAGHREAGIRRRRISRAAPKVAASSRVSARERELRRFFASGCISSPGRRRALYRARFNPRESQRSTHAPTGYSSRVAKTKRPNRRAARKQTASQCAFREMELAGLEPATSWVRSRRSNRVSPAHLRAVCDAKVWRTSRRVMRTLRGLCGIPSRERAYVMKFGARVIGAAQPSRS